MFVANETVEYLDSDPVEGTSTGITVCSVDYSNLKDWDKRILQSDGGSWRQSTYYGEYKRDFWHEIPVYLIASEQGVILGQLLVFFTHPYGWSLNRHGLLSLAPVLDRVFPWVYCAEGPIVFDGKRFVDVHEALYTWVIEEARRRGCVGCSLTPSFYDPFFLTHRETLKERLAKIGFLAKEKSTFVVDLDGSEEELFTRLKKEARNKVRKGEKQGIKVDKIGDTAKEADLMLQAMRETASRNSVAPITRKTFEKSSWKCLYNDGLSHGFISRSTEGHLLSSQQCVKFNGIISLGGVSYTDFSRDSSLYGNDLVQWRVIQWGLHAGCRLIDFTGVSPNSKSEKMKAIYAFKSKWGGRKLDYVEFTFEFSNIRQLVHQFITRKIGSLLKGLYRRIRFIQKLR